MKVSSGGPTAWTTACAIFCGNTKLAYGGRIDMVMAQGQPAMIYDRAEGGADAPGVNILFQKRRADLSWTAPTSVLAIGNTFTGGSIAYDPTEGYGVAVLEHSQDKLFYANSVDGTSMWSIGGGPIVGGGSTGWYPSLAMDPVWHEPAVAYYVCSKNIGLNEGTCPAAEDELRVIQRIGPQKLWTEALVDPAGGVRPKLGFFASGKRVIAYRLPGAGNGHLRVAVER